MVLLVLGILVTASGYPPFGFVATGTATFIGITLILFAVLGWICSAKVAANCKGCSCGKGKDAA